MNGWHAGGDASATHSLRERVPPLLLLDHRLSAAVPTALLFLVVLPSRIGRLATLGVYQTSDTVHYSAVETGTEAS